VERDRPQHEFFSLEWWLEEADDEFSMFWVMHEVATTHDTPEHPAIPMDVMVAANKLSGTVGALCEVYKLLAERQTSS
jgi:hypothetical protein